MTPPDSDNFNFLISGIDSLYVTYDVDTRTGKVDFGDLSYRQATLKDDRKRDALPITLGGLDLHLLPYGSHPYKWQFKHTDFTLKLARLMSPALLVEFRSEALWSKGAPLLYQTILDFIGACGFRQVGGSTVSRADIAFDYHLPHRDFTEDHVFSRLRKNSTYRSGKTTETIRYGTGDIVFRAYDKSAEITQSSGKSWFHDLWSRKDDVWRLEFQFRRDALKEHGIDDFGDLGERLPKMLLKIAEGHTSIRRPNGDSNPARWPLHPLWQDLLERIAELPIIPRQEAKIDRKRTLLEQRDQSRKAIIGNLKNFAALDTLIRDEGSVPSITDVAAAILSHASDDLHPEEWRLAVEDKMQSIKARS